MSYIEPDRPYFAKQFNGPVIRNVFKAVYNFLHKDVDAHAAYFRNLSIETANTNHLYFIGNIMGLQLFELFSDYGGGVYITYTDEEYDAEESYSYNNGWSSSYGEGQEGDGVFSTGSETPFPVTLTDTQYRAILTAISQVSSASIDSIHTMDVLVHTLLESNDYNFNYNNGYTDVLNLVLGETVQIKMTNILQSMFDRLFDGGSVTVLVSHI